jgi:hypothetical protein
MLSWSHPTPIKTTELGGSCFIPGLPYPLEMLLLNSICLTPLQTLSQAQSLSLPPIAVPRLQPEGKSQQSPAQRGTSVKNIRRATDRRLRVRDRTDQAELVYMLQPSKEKVLTFIFILKYLFFIMLNFFSTS